MKKLLFLDACISTHESRTKRLCETYIDDFIEKNPDIKVETVVLREGTVVPLTAERIKERDGYVRTRDWSQPMFDLANQLKEADYVVIGTPYWDLSFASILKVYIENIMVADLTFGVTDQGFVGLCKGEMLTYITTAGGFIGNKNFGYDYMVGVAEMLGIKQTQTFNAQALDIVGFDAETIMGEAVEKIHESFK